MFFFLTLTAQTVVYDLMRKYLGSGSMYTALGNHDSYNQWVVYRCSAAPVQSFHRAQASPHALGGDLENQFSWYDRFRTRLAVCSDWSRRNYDHIAALWHHESWLPAEAVASARAHYGGYSVRRADGLRVITLNTDFWYKSNYFAYINMTADTSGMLRFLTDELQDAEDTGDRGLLLCRFAWS